LIFSHDKPNNVVIIHQGIAPPSSTQKQLNVGAHSTKDKILSKHFCTKKNVVYYNIQIQLNNYFKSTAFNTV